MDNDDLRRGKPTNHKVFGEAAAILAGDALLTHAMEVMARQCAASRSSREAKAMYAVTKAAGANGMVAGQMLDIKWEHKKADKDTLITIQEGKTMAIIAACAEAGAILGGATPAVVEKYKYLGQSLGRAFQIKDDLLDIYATEKELGKSVGSDAKNQKNTYVSVLGIEKAEADYKTLSDEARCIAASLPQKSTSLIELIEKNITRVY
jgi:geranylgeranyl diphosphate synthase type II